MIQRFHRAYWLMLSFALLGGNICSGEADDLIRVVKGDEQSYPIFVYDMPVDTFKGNAVKLAAWDNGKMIWFADTEDMYEDDNPNFSPPQKAIYYEVSVAPEVIDDMMDQWQIDGILQDIMAFDFEGWYAGMEKSFQAIIMTLPASHYVFIRHHEHKIDPGGKFLTHDGKTFKDVNGQTLSQLLADQPPDYVAFRLAWQRITDDVEALIASIPPEDVTVHHDMSFISVRADLHELRNEK